MEVLWNDNPKTDFLQDLKSFALSLDFYQISFDLEQPNENKYARVENCSYEILSTPEHANFKCPVCENVTFEVMEGVFNGKATLGLCCVDCETYGAVFPNGM